VNKQELKAKLSGMIEDETRTLITVFYNDKGQRPFEKIVKTEFEELCDKVENCFNNEMMMVVDEQGDEIDEPSIVLIDVK
jgi:hypothetical protein